MNPGADWYAIWTRSRHEQVVREQLEQKGIEAFLPTIPKWSRWKDRKKKIDWPLFPGYCFARFDARERLAVLKGHTSGISGLALAIPVAALFTIMTKVGLYAMIRVSVSVFPAADPVFAVLGVIAGLTMITGALASAASSPTWAEPSADGSRVYVTCNRAGEVLEIDTERWEITRRILVWYFSSLSFVNVVYGSLATALG